MAMKTVILLRLGFLLRPIAAKLFGVVKVVTKPVAALTGSEWTKSLPTTAEQFDLSCPHCDAVYGSMPSYPTLNKDYFLVRCKCSKLHVGYKPFSGSIETITELST